MPSHYDILKVAHDAPVEVIRAAYRALSQRHHPDRNPGDAAAAVRMQALNEAYAVLSDPPRRQAYDAALAVEPGVTAMRRPGAPVAAGRGRSTGGRAHRTEPAPVATASRPHRQGGLLALALLAVAVALGSVALLHDAGTRALPAEVSATVEPAPWAMRGLDSPPSGERRSVPTPGPVPQVPAATPGPPDPVLPVMPATDPGAFAAPTASTAGLPIVADPNGRPWPWQAGEVEGLPQARVDGLATVTVDNRNNAWPAFVKLVALDDGASVAVRHVYVPAMQVFRIDSIGAGRYELRFQNLVTGEVSRSGEFELRQVEQGNRVRFSELDVTLYRVPGGALGVSPLTPDQF